jgi:putative ABC transport system permease protein
MFFNFIKTTFRSFLKNRTYVFINLIGLALSLATCIVAYLNYDYGTGFDRQHQNLNRIYKIQVQKDTDYGFVDYGISPLALGKSLEGKRSEVSQSCRYTTMGMVIKRDEILFDERIAFVDDPFFKMFDYPFIYGSSETLKERSGIILSQETSEKYFGEKNPVGEVIQLIDTDGKIKSYKVTGVLKKIPQNSSMRFSGLMHFDDYLDFNNVTDHQWDRFIAATFIMTKSGDFPTEIQQWLNSQFIEVQNNARENWKVDRYYLQDFASFGSIAEDLRSQWLNQPPPKPAIIVPMIMAILMLLIACFNFTNTSLATSSKRLKEIGIRRVLGGNRQQLVIQFMGENIVLSMIALLLAIVISIYLVPAYNAMWDFIDIKFDLLSQPDIFLFLLILLVVTSVIAGIYPSLYVSSFKPVAILRGTMQIGGVSRLSQVLLGGQFSLTVLSLIASYAFVQNAQYQQSLDIGYDSDNILAVRVYNEGQYESFKNRLTDISEISEVAGTGNHIGAWDYSRTLQHTEGTVDAEMLDISPEYMALMNVEILNGRGFGKETEEYDKANSIIVNETFLKQVSWEDPIGRYLQMSDSTRLKVVGVMKDLHMWGFWTEIEPMAFRPIYDDQYHFVAIKTHPGKIGSVKEQVEKIWYEIEPDKPINMAMQDEYLEETLLVNRNITTMFMFIGLLALVLSLIGLYTLVSLSVLKRVKEIGIRKVLGARIVQIVHLINIPYYWTFGIACILGSVMAWLAIDGLMASVFAYYKNVSASTLATPLVITCLVAFGIAMIRIIKAAIQNPVKSLRYE